MFGLGAVDLLCLVGGAVLGWWLYIALPIEPAPRAVLAGASLAFGSSFGVARFDGRSARILAFVLVAFLARPRVLRTGGRP